MNKNRRFSSLAAAYVFARMVYIQPAFSDGKLAVKK